MAIDFLVFGLLLVSFITNLLALAAFWVTPGLRTTANRFTINLLIINLAGCLILAPTLFLGSVGSTGFDSNAADETALTSSKMFSNDSIELYSMPGKHQMTIRHNGKLVEQEGIIIRRNQSTAEKESTSNPRTIETIYKCNSTYCQELTIDENSNSIVITKIEEENQLAEQAAADDVQKEYIQVPPIRVRYWSIDMAAALGALAVLLVVGDTWCAVTDPLRYHSRISGLKAWMFIGLTWLLGILFGALSALRELDFESDVWISKQKRYTTSYSETYLSLSSTSGIFGVIFACLYFVIIILMPFGFVCGMYWRIFSEARENGLRIRQNGSSPLLQSALNLTHQQQSSSLPYANSLYNHRNSISSMSSYGGGLQLQLDQRNNNGSSAACLRRDSAAKVLLPTISDDGMSDEADIIAGNVPEQSDRNQNILLTLQSASGEIKRNYSVRQLPLLGTSSQDFHETQRLQGMRQIHSSPNLQRYTQAELSSSASPYLLGRQQLQLMHIGRHNSHPPQPQSQGLQIPGMNGSPKTLGYMSSLRHRLSNASSLFKYREESRAARISILVVIMFLVSYLPYGFLVLLQSRVPAFNFRLSTELAVTMILFGNLSSPFIFAYRNKRVRRGVKRLFGLDKRSREQSMQRKNTFSGRDSGLLFQNGEKCNVIKRNDSRISTHSMNITPQNSLAHANKQISSTITPAHHATIALKPNQSCSILVNFSLANETDKKSSPTAKHQSSYVVGPTPPHQQHQQPCQTKEGQQRPKRPVLQRGVTVVEEIPVHQAKLADKGSIWKIFFRNSLNPVLRSFDNGSALAKPTEV